MHLATNSEVAQYRNEAKTGYAPPLAEHPFSASMPNRVFGTAGFLRRQSGGAATLKIAAAPPTFLLPDAPLLLARVFQRWVLFNV